MGWLGRLLRTCLLCGLGLGFVAGCAMPRSGPTRAEIVSGAADPANPSPIIEVDARVVEATRNTPLPGFGITFRNTLPISPDLISPGDILTLRVYENVRDAPLLSESGGQGTIQDLVVDGDGYIFVPYAGPVRAAGLTIEALRVEITELLELQTPSPQVLLNRAAGDGATVSVSGNIGAGIFPIERPTRTLIGMLARAGGVQSDPGITLVRVTRGRESGQVWLSDLYEDPGLDIALRPGDRIMVEEDRRAFIALGATGQQTRVPFESAEMSALDALSRVGGLSADLADPTGIFILRRERADTARALGAAEPVRDPQPIIYLLDLTSPKGLFLAGSFEVRDGDVFYVTEAPYAQWRKMTSALFGAASSAAQFDQLAN
jgi:polysaccharide export outer membrane protein